MAGARSLFVVALAVVLAEPLLAQTRTLAITGVTVIDPSPGAAPRPNQTILIRDGVIRAVGPAARTAVPAGAQVVDGRGRFAIPGLWDMHVHFMNTGESALPLLLALGVTSVREMGGYIDSTRHWQSRMAAGTLAGPRIITAGPILEASNVLARMRVRESAYRVGVADSTAAQRVVDSLARLRVDFVKFRTVQSRSAWLGILHAARRAGLRVAGHAPSGVSLFEASDSGQSTIEHAFMPPLDSAGPFTRNAVADHFVRNRTWYVPTLVVSRGAMLPGDSGVAALDWGTDSLSPRRYAYRWLIDWWRTWIDGRVANPNAAREIERYRLIYRSSLTDVRALHAAGVNIVAGTDAGSTLVYPGFSLHEELLLLVEGAGFTPREALWSATLGPARWAGLESSLGTIAVGHQADLVLLDADPLASIRNTTRITGVMQGGHYRSRADLDSLLAGIRAGVAAERH